MANRVWYYLPRILAIAFILFLSVFALDSFNDPQWLLALVMHLIPSFILIILTIVAWKNKLVGGILWLAAGGVMTFFFHSLTIALPAYAIGILFLVSPKKNVIAGK